MTSIGITRPPWPDWGERTARPMVQLLRMRTLGLGEHLRSRHSRPAPPPRSDYALRHTAITAKALPGPLPSTVTRQWRLDCNWNAMWPVSSIAVCETRPEAVRRCFGIAIFVNWGARVRFGTEDSPLIASGKTQKTRRLSQPAELRGLPKRITTSTPRRGINARLAGGAFDLAGGFVDGAFDFQLGVAGDFTGSFLDRALGLVHGAVNTILVHVISFAMGWGCSGNPASARPPVPQRNPAAACNPLCAQPAGKARIYAVILRCARNVWRSHFFPRKASR